MNAPDIPTQADPWNNEYTVSISTQYTEHETVRKGVYERMLRSPLTMTNFSHPNPPETYAYGAHTFPTRSGDMVRSTSKARNR
jgi:hypothetical protein